ncbi:hypothetical protein QVD17_39402 [Tagetes erecta]|uniref:Uncharacterized protein n=1 Tax=Tagetes erecta TaxID=13708 RepID=A0AAD8NA57_TARER|nr:hypothetical protein QVD17_39402 [Tagetes erecta]
MAGLQQVLKFAARWSCICVVRADFISKSGDSKEEMIVPVVDGDHENTSIHGGSAFKNEELIIVVKMWIWAAKNKWS